MEILAPPGQARHIFIVHSGITEIIGIRISERLINAGICVSSEITFVCTRGYTQFSSNIFSFTCETLNDLSGSYICGKESFSDYLETESIARCIAGYPASRYFYIYTPHTRLKIARALIRSHYCLGYSILEEGDLSYNYTPKRLSRTQCLLTEHQTPLKTKWLPIVLSMYSWKRVIGDILRRKAPAAQRIAYEIYSLDFHCWFYANHSKFLSFYRVSPGAFLQTGSNYIITLDEPSAAEMCKISELQTKYNSLKGCELLLLQSPLSFSHAPFDVNKYVFSRQSQVILRQHPMDPRTIAQACEANGISLENVNPYSEALANEPLELQVYALKLVVLNPSISSLRRYLNLYDCEQGIVS